MLIYFAIYLSIYLSISLGVHYLIMDIFFTMPMKHVKPAFLAFFIVFITVLFSCQTDDGYVETSKQIIPFHFESFTLNGKNLAKQHPKVSDRINHLNNLVRQKSVAASSITLDTTNIKVIQHAAATSYIFRVKDSLLTGAVKNYVLVRLRDSLWHQYMVHYPLDAMNQVITSQTTIEPVFGDDLLQQFNLKCGGISYVSVWVDGYTINHPCTAGGNHTVDDGDKCTAWGKPGGATVTVVFGHFETQSIAQDPCGNGGGGSSSSGGGANTGSPNPDSPTNGDDMISIGIVPNIFDPEIIIDPKCNDVAVFVSNPLIKPKLDELRGNLNMRTETGYLFETDLTNNYTTPTYLNGTTNNGTSLNIPLPTDASLGAAHVHFNSYSTPGLHPVTGVPVDIITSTIPIQSPQDTSMLLRAVEASIVPNRSELFNELRIQNKFNIVVNQKGMYMIKYEGNIQMLPSNFDGQSQDLKDKYIKAVDEDPEGGYLRFLKDELAIYNIGLYQIKRNGDVYRITLDENDKKVKVKCHDN